MNPLHYPSLELCKKLTEALYPHNTEHYEGAFYYEYPNGRNFISDGNPVWLPENPYQQYLCPSVMELLDEMPNWITVKYKDGDVGNYKLEIGRQGTSESIEAYYVHYVEGNGAYVFCLGTLPNALAEMWLWLKENNYLTK